MSRQRKQTTVQEESQTVAKDTSTGTTEIPLAEIAEDAKNRSEFALRAVARILAAGAARALASAGSHD